MIAIILGAFGAHALKKFLVRAVGHFWNGRTLPNVSCVFIVYRFIDELTDAVKKNNLFSTMWFYSLVRFIYWLQMTLPNLILNASDL
jgi:hypothetical protein